MSLTYEAEKQFAVSAVRRACRLTSTVFDKLVKNETLTKGDKSPVTGNFPQIRGFIMDLYLPFSRRFRGTSAYQHHVRKSISR